MPPCVAPAYACLDFLGSSGQEIENVPNFAISSHLEKTPRFGGRLMLPSVVALAGALLAPPPVTTSASAASSAPAFSSGLANSAPSSNLQRLLLSSPSLVPWEDVQVEAVEGEGVTLPNFLSERDMQQLMDVATATWGETNVDGGEPVDLGEAVVNNFESAADGIAARRQWAAEVAEEQAEERRLSAKSMGALTLAMTELMCGSEIHWD